MKLNESTNEFLGSAAVAPHQKVEIITESNKVEMIDSSRALNS
jgi:hypothetical protein